MVKSRQKIDNILWAIVWMLPFFEYFVAFYRSGVAPKMMEYISTNYSFEFIKNILDNVTTTAFGATFALNGYISYLVGVAIIHILFDVIVFIPRFAHDVVDFATSWGRGKK